MRDVAILVCTNELSKDEQISHLTNMFREVLSVVLENRGGEEAQCGIIIWAINLLYISVIKGTVWAGCKSSVRLHTVRHHCLGPEDVRQRTNCSDKSCVHGLSPGSLRCVGYCSTLLRWRYLNSHGWSA